MAQKVVAPPKGLLRKEGPPTYAILESMSECFWRTKVSLLSYNIFATIDIVNLKLLQHHNHSHETESNSLGKKEKKLFRL